MGHYSDLREERDVLLEEARYVDYLMTERMTLEEVKFMRAIAENIDSIKALKQILKVL